MQKAEDAHVCFRQAFDRAKRVYMATLMRVARPCHRYSNSTARCGTAGVAGGHSRRNSEAYTDSLPSSESMRTKDTIGVGVRLGRAISNLKTHGVAPCINMGLHRRLSKHFLVADTPAHYTSRTCSNVQKCLVVFGSVRGTWA